MNTDLMTTAECAAYLGETTQTVACWRLGLGIGYDLPYQVIDNKGNGKICPHLVLLIFGL